jgi:hypothetical protein
MPTASPLLPHDPLALLRSSAMLPASRTVAVVGRWDRARRASSACRALHIHTVRPGRGTSKTFQRLAGRRARKNFCARQTNSGRRL